MQADSIPIRATMPAYPNEPMTWVTKWTKKGRMCSVMGPFQYIGWERRGPGGSIA